jgi:intracellular multiplication protein IcmL
MSDSRQINHGKNAFYRDYYEHVIYILLIAICAILFLGSLVMYQVVHRPLPRFSAVMPDGRGMLLTSYDVPNLMPNTLIHWASKAAVAAYTFNFVDHIKQINQSRPYFTEGGWQAYQSAIESTVKRIVKQQLFVYGVVTDPPVISNQGDRPKQGYSWRIQIPYLATYQSPDGSINSNYYVLLTIVKVPTIINPDAIGIETFEMRELRGGL